MKKTIAAILALAATMSMTPGLSAADEPAQKKGPFVVADANGDGKLDLAEYTQMVSKRMDADKAKARFAELDKDGDSALTRQEFNAGRKQGDGEKNAEAGAKKAAKDAAKGAAKESKKSPD